MKQFYPQTWSMESITPVWKGAFRKDLHEVIENLYNTIVPLADEQGEKYKLQLTFGLKTANRREKKDISNKVKDIIRCIKKHTNLELDDACLALKSDPNASAGGKSILYIYGVDPLSRDFMQYILSDKSELEDFINHHKSAMMLDRKIGKFHKEVKMHGRVLIHSAFFDKVYNNLIPLDTITDVILHELGHVFDCYDAALRMNWVSDLAEDLVDYEEDTFGVDEAKDALKRIGKMINIELPGVPWLTKNKIKKLYKELVTSEETDLDWVQTVSALYTLLVRAVEFSRLGFMAQDIFSNDTFKGAERRADKFAALQGAGTGIVDYLQTMIDYTKLMQLSGMSKFQARLQIRLIWTMLRSNTADYDTTANRINEILRTMYLRMSFIAENVGKDAVKADLEAIDIIKQAYEESKHTEDILADSCKIFDTIVKYGTRAIGILVSRSRLSENSILTTAIRNTARSSLHADAARLKQLTH